MTSSSQCGFLLTLVVTVYALVLIEQGETRSDRFSTQEIYGRHINMVSLEDISRVLHVRESQTLNGTKVPGKYPEYEYYSGHSRIYF